MDAQGRSLVVVGVDGSTAADHALAWAVKLAHRLGAAVEVVTAWSAKADTHAGSPTLPLAAYAEAERVQRDCTARVLPGARGATSLAMQVVEGAPGSVLVEAARKADMLVMGSHGHRKLYSVLMGSTSEHCLRHATCPVVVIPVPVHDPEAARDDVALRNP